MIAHGVLMGVVWSILFPAGAIVIQFLHPFVSSPTGKHRVVQLSAVFIMLTAGGMGFYLCQGHQFTLFRISSECV